MKADRKRLKAEKTDLVSQMQQLYATLDSREEQLRDFIRNYEQHRKVRVCLLFLWGFRLDFFGVDPKGHLGQSPCSAQGPPHLCEHSEPLQLDLGSLQGWSITTVSPGSPI